MIRTMAVASLIVIILAMIGGCLILDAIDDAEAAYEAEQTESSAWATAAYGAEQFHIQLTAQAGSSQ